MTVNCDHVRFGQRGSAVEIFEPVTLIDPANIYLHNHIRVSEYCWIQGGAKTVVGNCVHIASFVTISGGGFVLIEDFVGVCSGARIISGTDMADGTGLVGPTVPPECRAVERSYVHLGKHAFVGTNVVVHPGVTIGEGTVVGSNSLVTSDLEPWTIYVGSPARPVRSRPNGKLKQLEKVAYEKLQVAALNPDLFVSLKATTIHRPASAP